jgi:hypothetical protein
LHDDVPIIFQGIGVNNLYKALFRFRPPQNFPSTLPKLFKSHKHLPLKPDRPTPRLTREQSTLMMKAKLIASPVE